MKIKLTWFELISLLWISAAMGCLVIAYLGLFYPFFVVLWIVADLGSTWWLWKKKHLLIDPLEKGEKKILIGLAVFALILSIFTTPTIFGGRDEGSFSSAAIMLSNDHELIHESDLIENFSEIYGVGKALNFPGFQYPKEGKLESQFLPGYTSWLAGLYSIGKLNALKFANFFAFLTFLFSFYLVIGSFAKKKTSSLVGLLILVTSVPIIIFYKFTLTEIFFASLLWFSLHLLLRYLQDKSYSNYFLILLPLFLSAFVRIEALAISFIVLLILIWKDHVHLSQPRYQLLFVILGIIFGISIISNSHFYAEGIKGFAGLTNSGESTGAGFHLTSLLPDDWRGFYLVKLFFNYNLLPFFFLFLAFVIDCVRKKDWDKLLPLIFFLPTLIYFVDANISLDHPWMLRRFVFTLIPLSIFYSVLLLESFQAKQKKFYWLIVGIVLLTNVFSSAPFVLKSQNKNLFDQTKTLSKKFTSKDLILISQKSSGSGWSLISEPMRNVLNLDTIYFFRPTDLYDIDQDEYVNIYLVVSAEEEELFDELSKELVESYSIENEIILPLRDPMEKPRFEKQLTSGNIYQLEKFDN